MHMKRPTSALITVGEAQLAAAEGMSELGRELARYIGKLFRKN